MRFHSARNKMPAKRRTTLTLPAESLAAAERLAKARNVNLSTVISEVIEEGLRLKLATQRSAKILQSYGRAFSGFSAEERFLLDGIVLDEHEG